MAQQLLTICNDDELDGVLLEEEVWGTDSLPPKSTPVAVGSVPVCPSAVTTPNAITCNGKSVTE